jgi:predicted CoA-binding protein
MSTVNELVQDFLAQKKIAVVGVSDKRETGCNAAYKKFKQAGYTVSAVNPRLTTFEDDPCYPDLKSIPEKPDAVFILTNPKVTEEIVQQCLMGTKPGLAVGMTSVSQDAVHMCHENGITVIPGACPNQFLHADFGHAMMRVMFRTFGFHRLN